MNWRKKLKKMVALWLAAVLCCCQLVVEADGQGSILLYIKTSLDNLESGDLVTGRRYNVKFDVPLDGQFEEALSIPEGCQLAGWNLWSYSYDGHVTDNWKKHIDKDGVISQADITDCFKGGTGTRDMLVEPEFISGDDIKAIVPVITVDESRWEGFSGQAVFNHFYKSGKSMEVTLEKDSNDPDHYEIYYYLADSNNSGGLLEEGSPAPAADRVEQIMEAKDLSWTAYEEPVSLIGDGRYILYVKVVNREKGTCTYASSGGIVIDSTNPMIFTDINGQTGALESGGSYYGNLTFWAEDTNLAMVMVDGRIVNLQEQHYTIFADNKEHVITARDFAGNEVSCSIYVYKELLPREITESGEYLLLRDIPYKLSGGTWTIPGDRTVYQGDLIFYVSETTRRFLCKSDYQ